MNGEQIINDIINGQTRETLYIYRYDYRWVLVEILIPLLFLGFGYLLLILAEGNPTLIFGALVIGVYFAYKLLRSLYSLPFFKRNMVVLTDSSLIVSLRGKIKEIPYKNINNLMSHHYSGYILPKNYIKFIDSRDNKPIKIGEKDYLPDFQNFLTTLKSKLT